MRLVRQNYLNGGIAVFFILFAFTDLSLPQICSEELGGRCLQGVSQPGLSDRARELSVSESSGQTEQQPSQNTEGSSEECFCCCSHIVPGSHFCVDLFELESLVTAAVNHSLPTSSPNNPFHPPRIS